MCCCFFKIVEESPIPGTSFLDDRIDGIHHQDAHIECRTLIDGILFYSVTAKQNLQFRYSEIRTRRFFWGALRRR